jgi:hypothetical protein
VRDDLNLQQMGDIDFRYFFSNPASDGTNSYLVRTTNNNQPDPYIAQLVNAVTGVVVSTAPTLPSAPFMLYCKDGTFYASSNNSGTTTYSTAGGWQAFSSDYVVRCVSNGIVYGLATGSGAAYFSSDGGASWVALADGIELLNVFDIVEFGGQVYVAGRTADNGTSVYVNGAGTQFFWKDYVKCHEA